MRIAMVCWTAAPSAPLAGIDIDGRTLYLSALAAELARRDHHVDVHLLGAAPGPASSLRTTPGVELDHVDEATPPTSLDAEDQLGSRLAEYAEILHARWMSQPPDVIHAHGWCAGVAALDAAASLGIAVVQTFHGLGVVEQRHPDGPDRTRGNRIRAERRILTRAEQVIATCSQEVRELSALGADHHRLSVVPPGVDLELFGPDGPVVPRNPAFPHRLLAVGPLVPHKAVDDIIRALADVADTELLIAGGPPSSQPGRPDDAGGLDRLATHVGVADRVRFLGPVDHGDFPALMRSADVVVSVPTYEPFGRVPVEAMATATPVVVSAVGGMLDTVQHDVTGVYVPPGDPAALAAALTNLLQDPARRAWLARNGRAHARARYGWACVADGVLAAYDATLRRPSPQTSSP